MGLRARLAAVGVCATALALPATLLGVVSPRVVGGAPAPASGWPAIAGVISTFPGPPQTQTLCGGTLIDPQWVLTAGHCTFDPTTNAPATPAQMQVRLGTTDLTAPAEVHGVAVIVRDGFVPGGASFRNDVALLQLTSVSALPPMNLVSPIDDARWVPGALADVAGWGLTTPPPAGTPSVSQLQEAQVPVIADTQCGADYGADFIAQQMVCAGFPAGGVDSCNGDSGGPLAVHDAGGARVLIGVVSFGNGCAQPGFPGVYAEAAAFRDFIYGNIGVVPPQAPAVTVTPGPQEVTVSWVPGPSGGRAVTTWIVNGLPTPVPPQPGGATNLVVPLPAGTQVTPTVTAVTPAGISPVGTGQTVRALHLPPVSLGPPAIAARPRRGQTLTAPTGSWSNQPDPLLYAYAWERSTRAGFTTIPGAKDRTYLPTLADVGHPLRVVVTAANDGGSGSAVSVVSAAVEPAAPAPIQKPRIAGTPRAGRTLSARNGKWSDPVTRYSYTWQLCTRAGRSCRAIRGAAGPTYRARAADIGFRLRLVVTAKNATGSGRGVSAVVGPVRA